MRNAIALTLAVIAAGLVAAAAPPAADEAFDLAGTYFRPLPKVAETPDNPVTEAKVALGRMLYFDTRLSAKGNVSCNSCHALDRYGVDNRAFSPGDDGELGGRNSPTVYNAALHIAQFWDGRAADVEEQAGMPILNPVEMAMPDPQVVVERIAADNLYTKLFAAAFPEERPAITYDNLGRAIGAFERTLITPSRFDAFLEGDRNALTADEKAGLVAFVDNGCVTCHNGQVVGGGMLQKFGTVEDYWVATHSAKVDEGRFAETGQPLDKYVFKVAALRNVAETAPYFHDGSVTTLPEAIRVMAKVQLGRELPADELESMVAFLESLTGEIPPSARPPRVSP